MQGISKRPGPGMTTTTGRVYTNDMAWAKNAMDILGIPSFQELIKMWRKECKLSRQREFYNRITDVEKVQPLKGVCIQK